MLKKTLMILLVLLVPGVAALAGAPSAPLLADAQSADVQAADSGPVADSGPAVEREAQATARPSDGQLPQPVFLGGCLYECLGRCDNAADACYGTCGTPICYFHCRQQAAACADACYANC